MWLMTARGFYSVVEHRDDPARLHVEGLTSAGLWGPPCQQTRRVRNAGESVPQAIALLACRDQRRAR